MTTEERVIDRKVIGSSNPIARKFRDIGSAFKGIGFGFVLLVVGIVLVYFSVRGVKEYSKVVEALPMQETTTETNSGLVKTKGELFSNTPITFEYKNCSSILGCKQPSLESKKLENILYVSATWQRYEIVKEVRTETRTKTENGQDIQETVEITEYNEKWVDKKTDEKWAGGIMLDNIKLAPENAQIKLNYQTSEDNKVFIDGAGEINNYGQQASSEIGNTRIQIKYIPNNLKEIIVVGNLSNNQMVDGEPFILTNMSDSELVESLKSSENTQRLVMRVLAWLALTIGFAMIIAPIMEIVEIVPVLGNSIKSFAGIVGAVVSLVIVIAGVLIIKYWYIILALGILILGLIVFAIIKKLSSK